MRFRRLVPVLAGVALAVLVCLVPAQSLQIFHEGFEGTDPLWVRGMADANFKETVHRITDEHFHLGQHSEQIQFEAETGTQIFYYFDTPRTPVAEDTVASIRLKSPNKMGMVLVGRVILPREHNPNNPQEPLAVMIQSEPYDLIDKWEKLQLAAPAKLLRDQQARLQLDTKRAIDITDAYIDRLMVNVYGGPGLTDVFIDDLEIGPALDRAPAKPVSRPDQPEGSRPIENQPINAFCKDGQLQVDGKPFLLRAIRHTDTPINVLHDAGFNTIDVDENASPDLLQQVAQLRLRLMVDLPIFTPDQKQLLSPDAVQETMRRFRQPDSVLIWNVGGGGLTAEECKAVDQAASNIQSSDPRPVATDLWDGFDPYSKSSSVKMVGTHRWPLMSSLELLAYREWLNERRGLSWPGTYMWTWIQDHLPEPYTNLVYEQSSTQPFSEPIGPQPEQVRLLTYLALSAGYRGLGFWSDRFLAESHQGHDRMLELALINQELTLLEPVICSSTFAPTWVETSNGNVRAAVFRSPRGVLVIPIWVGSGSQYVTGQASLGTLSITVPAPDSAQAWQVSPGELRSVKIDRVMGGKKVTINEFDLTSAIVFTADNGPNGLLVYFQDRVRQMSEPAAQWSMMLAQKELEKVQLVEADLNRLGHSIRNEDEYLGNAREQLAKCQQHYTDHEYRECFLDAQRAMRPLRIIMRNQWEQAAKELSTPVASPYAVSYYTLPRHWQMMDTIKKTTPGTNLLTGGDFETPASDPQSGWMVQNPVPLDEVELSAQRVSEEHHDGNQALKLEVRAKNPQQLPSALERTFLAIHSPEVNVEPGTFIQVSGWVLIPKPITASADGALLYDSIGDSPLGVRLSTCPKWQRFVLYRKVPASGKVRVSMALTGVGAAYFDDVRIEKCEPK
jgi:hypothetical protein